MSNKQKTRQPGGVSIQREICFFCACVAKLQAEKDPQANIPCQFAITWAPVPTPAGAASVPCCMEHLPITSKQQLLVAEGVSLVEP